MGTVTVTVTVDETELTFDVEVSKAPKSAWTEEEATLLASKLYGVVLPFANPESTISYDSFWEVIKIEGGAANEKTFTAYENALVEAGFVSKSNDVYKYEKVVTTEGVRRYIEVYFGTGESGEFYLEAYSLYYYTFPGKIFGKMAEFYFSSEIVPPAFEADAYQYDDSNSAIYCYTTSQTAVADYTQILEDAGWELLGYDASTKYYDAVSPDGTYMIHYAYDAYYGDLDIIMSPCLSWKSTLIERFFNKYNGTYVTVPAFNVNGAAYQFVEAINNPLYYQEGNIEFIHADMYVMLPQNLNGLDALASYAEFLKNNGWDVSGSDTYYVAKSQIDDKGIFRLELRYLADSNTVDFTFYIRLDPIPGAGFPSKEVAEILGFSIADTLPVYLGENNGFTVLNDYFGTAVVVEVDENTEEDAIAAYIDTLQEAGYHLFSTSSSEYTSPNEEILVQVYCGTPGSFTIEFKASPTTTWPATRIGRLIKGFFNGNDVLPAYDGGFEYGIDVDEDDNQFNIYLYLEDEDKEFDEAIAEYEEILKNANFKFDHVDDYDGNNVYLSPNGEYYVSCWVDVNTLDIVVYPVDATASKWPNSDVNQFLADNNVTDVIPEYNGEYTSAEFGVWYSTNYVLVKCDNPSEALEAYGDFLEDEANGYKFVSVSFGSYIYNSPNGQLTLTLSTEEDGLFISIEVNEVAQHNNEGGFPIDKVVEVFADAQGNLPVLEDENATFEFADYGQLEIDATFADADQAEAYCEAYVAALKTAGFSEVDMGGGYMKYVKEGLSFYVMVDYWGNVAYITIVANS